MKSTPPAAPRGGARSTRSRRGRPRARCRPVSLEAPACLLDDQLDGGHVPRGRLARWRRRPRPRRRGRAARSRRKPRACQRASRASGSRAARRANAHTASSTARHPETWIGSPSTYAPSPRRPTSAARAPAPRRRPRRLAVLLERDQRRPDRDPARVVPRAVDRVDDPAPPAPPPASPCSSPRIAVAGARSRARRAAPLDLAVGVRDGRPVGLRLDARGRARGSGRARSRRPRRRARARARGRGSSRPRPYLPRLVTWRRWKLGFKVGELHGGRPDHLRLADLHEVEAADAVVPACQAKTPGARRCRVRRLQASWARHGTLSATTAPARRRRLLPAPRRQAASRTRPDAFRSTRARSVHWVPALQRTECWKRRAPDRSPCRTTRRGRRRRASCGRSTSTYLIDLSASVRSSTGTIVQ